MRPIERADAASSTFRRILSTGLGRSPVIRLNTADNKFTVLPLDLDDWVHHPVGDEVAAASIEITELHRLRVVTPALFLTRAITDKYGIGPGDETLAMGRFVNHEGNHAADTAS